EGQAGRRPGDGQVVADGGQLRAVEADGAADREGDGGGGAQAGGEVDRLAPAGLAGRAVPPLPGRVCHPAGQLGAAQGGGGRRGAGSQGIVAACGVGRGRDERLVRDLSIDRDRSDDRRGGREGGRGAVGAGVDGEVEDAAGERDGEPLGVVGRDGHGQRVAERV